MARTKRQQMHGTQAASVEELPVYVPTIETLLRDTVLIRVSSSFERGNRTLEFSDLGLENVPEQIRQFADRYVRLGQARLIDDTIIRALISHEQQLRLVLRNYGVRTPWGGWAIQKKHYVEVTTKLNELIAIMDGLVDRLVETRDEWVARLREDFRSLGVLAAGLREGVEPSLIAEIPSDRVDVEQYLDAIMSLVPSAAMIRNRYKVEWNAAKVANPRIAFGRKEIEALEAEKCQLQLDIDRIKHGTEAEVARMQLAAVEERIAIERRIHEESEARIAAMWEQEVASVVTEASTKVRDQIYTVVTEVQDMIAKHGTVSVLQVDKLKRLVDSVRALALGDDTMKERMDEFAKVLATIDTDRKRGAPPIDTKDLSAAMDDLAATARAELYKLNRAPRRVVVRDVEVDEGSFALRRNTNAARVQVASSDAPTTTATTRRGAPRKRPRDRTKVDDTPQQQEATS